MRFSGIFDHLVNLEFLDISNNHIKYIHENTFPINCQLKDVNLNNNELSLPDNFNELSKSPFWNCKDLEFWDSDNRDVNENYLRWIQKKSNHSLTSEPTTTFYTTGT